MYVLASGVLIAAVAAGIYDYLTIRDQVADLDADLAALDTRLAAVAEQQNAQDQEITTAPLPSPIRLDIGDDGLVFTCNPSGFVQWTEASDIDERLNRLNKWNVAGWIKEIESDSDGWASERWRGVDFWMRDCAAALG